MFLEYRQIFAISILLLPLLAFGQNLSAIDLLSLSSANDKIYLQKIANHGFVYDQEVGLKNSDNNEIENVERYKKEEPSQSIWRKNNSCHLVLDYSHIEVTKIQFELLENLVNDFQFIGFKIIHQAKISENKKRATLENSDGTIFISIEDLSLHAPTSTNKKRYSSWMTVTISNNNCE